METEAKKKPIQKIIPIVDEGSVLNKIENRKSTELVIAFSSPIGTGLKQVIEQFKSKFRTCGYNVHHIKVSDLIKANAKDLSHFQSQTFDNLVGFDRYNTLQEIGNELRSRFGETTLSEYVIQEIKMLRRKGREENSEDYQEKEIVTKSVYLVDQLKNPAELHLLRTVYGNLFHLIGVFCSIEDRKHNLSEARIEPSKIEQLIQRDRKEKTDSGQRLEETLQHADFFIENVHDNNGLLVKPIQRFIDLIHGKEGLTPTIDEAGMYAAYSASLGSACLSRQVGASISTSEGNILSSGCNDVPMAGGGLYTESSKDDFRCFNKGGKCWNQHHKKKLVQSIKEILLNEMGDSDKAQKIAERISSETEIKSLIEYSRSVHAELDAIIKLVRLGITIPKNSILYSTTYPCHNCAKHIIASGLTKVVYIEPYEKSLAFSLHDDSLTIDSGNSGKVVFEHFQGVSPRKYQYFFCKNNTKNKEGEIIRIDINEAAQVVPEFLDSYLKLEDGVIRHLVKKGIANN